MHVLLQTISRIFFLSLLFIPASGFCQDSLLFYRGEKITGIENWEKRRMEIKQLALGYIYGFMPPPPAWSVKVEQELKLNEQVLYKEVSVQLYKDSLPTRAITLSIFIPANQQKPVPVVLALNKCGNLAISSFSEVSLCADCFLHPACKKTLNKQGRTPESLRGAQSGYWALDTLLNRGYAFATFHESDIAADTASLEQGIFPFYPELKNESGWKIISAWAWGLQRAVDYLVSDKHIHPARIILFGHSRRGKAALLAAALDERVSMVVPHQTGTAGMALGRRHPMESIRRINHNFPYWFNDVFKTFSRKPKSLPLDQHFLAALMAPRPLMETTGKWDWWSSFRLSLKALRLASPVYELYGVKGVSGKAKVSKRKALSSKVSGNLVQVRRPYRHVMNADYWNFILDFADRQPGSAAY